MRSPEMITIKPVLPDHQPAADSVLSADGVQPFEIILSTTQRPALARRLMPVALAALVEVALLTGLALTTRPAPTETAVMVEMVRDPEPARPPVPEPAKPADPPKPPPAAKPPEPPKPPEPVPAPPPSPPAAQPHPDHAPRPSGPPSPVPSPPSPLPPAGGLPPARHPAERRPTPPPPDLRRDERPVDLAARPSATLITPDGTEPLTRSLRDTMLQQVIRDSGWSPPDWARGKGLVMNLRVDVLASGMLGAPFAGDQPFDPRAAITNYDSLPPEQQRMLSSLVQSLRMAQPFRLPAAARAQAPFAIRLDFPIDAIP